MKKGIIPKLSMGVALATAVAVCWTPAVRADLSGGSDTVTYSQGATTLVMPFDLTGNKISYEIVSVINYSGSFPIATHWSYWADDCRHLRDVTICLTPNDTVVVDPTKLHGEIQQPNPPVNNPTTPDFNIGKVRGSVFVTAFDADTGVSGLDCKTIREVTIPNSLIGSWTIADTGTNAAFGAGAIGIDGINEAATVGNGTPDPDALLGTVFGLGEGGLKLQTFNPQDLGDTDVIVLTVDTFGGFGSYENFEWGPIRQAETCCDVEFTDNLEINTSHPQFCFECSGFAAMGPDGALVGSTDPILLPAEINRPGVLHLFNCTLQADIDASGDLDIIGENGTSEQFLFAYHNQAVGQFGVTVNAFYTGPSGL